MTLTGKHLKHNAKLHVGLTILDDLIQGYYALVPTISIWQTSIKKNVNAGLNGGQMLRN